MLRLLVGTRAPGHHDCSNLECTAPLTDQIGGFHEAFRSSALVIVSSPSLLSVVSRNRSIPVWFTRYPRTALSDRWHSLGITSLMNIGGIRYVHIHSYIGHHDQACVLACKNTVYFKIS
ncbi:hypothetical protein TNCV_4492611 [Trichonephila clavipes]|nr:hypothetical protein TNCV_4492611 [Trichonephila clavipes]